LSECKIHKIFRFLTQNSIILITRVQAPAETTMKTSAVCTTPHSSGAEYIYESVAYNHPYERVGKKQGSKLNSQIQQSAHQGTKKQL